MLHHRLAITALALSIFSAAACSGQKDKPAPGAGSAAAASAAGDGLPAGYAVPAGGKLVDKGSENGASTWSYAYPIAPPTLAQTLAQDLAKAGWVVADRSVGDNDVVMAHRDGTVVTAVAIFGANAGASLLTIAIKPDAKLLVAPPAEYPAGFPFVPFAGFEGAEAKPDRTTLTFVYRGTIEQIASELKDATAKAGWACSGDPAVLSACRREGSAEVTVSLKSLSTGKTVLFVN